MSKSENESKKINEKLDEEQEKMKNKKKIFNQW